MYLRVKDSEQIGNYIGTEELRTRGNVIERYLWTKFTMHGEYLDSVEIFKTQDGKIYSDEDELNIKKDGAFHIRVKTNDNETANEYDSTIKATDLNIKYSYKKPLRKGDEELIFVNAFDEKFRYQWNAEKNMWRICGKF